MKIQLNLKGKIRKILTGTAGEKKRAKKYPQRRKRKKFILH